MFPSLLIICSVFMQQPLKGTQYYLEIENAASGTKMEGSLVLGHPLVSSNFLTMRHIIMYLLRRL